MKVHELITKLSTFNPSSKVEIIVGGTGSSIEDVEFNEEFKTVLIWG